MRQYDSYLVRVWRSDGEWAGRLEHVQGDRSLRFTTPGALLGYLQSVISGEETAAALAQGGNTDARAMPTTAGEE